MISERYHHPFGIVLQCEVCGNSATRWDLADDAPKDTARNGRCERHTGRNPCAIEGCKRSAAAHDAGSGIFEYANDAAICGHHWRAYVPARSRARRAYHAFHRRGRREDWPQSLRRKYWRFWDVLVRMARRRAGEGRIDLAKIERMFGGDI